MLVLDGRLARGSPKTTLSQTVLSYLQLSMRRLSAIAILFLLCLPMLYPLAVLASDDAQEAKLPICCRGHHGVHDCSMMTAYLISLMSGTKLTATPVPCHDAPCTVASSAHFNLGIGAAGMFFAELTSHPATHAQTEARARISLDRAWRKRGPPQLVLS
jgi:hypothetical protein